MTDSAANLQRLLVQLDSKYLGQAQTFLEYLVFLQQKERGDEVALPKTLNGRLKKAQQFKGDAPFPNTSLSKYDVYEQ